MAHAFSNPFEKEFGKPQTYRDADEEALERIRRDMPAAFADLVARDGFASYRNGAAWTCNPADWTGVVDEWSDRLSGGLVFLRWSDGRFYFWADDACWFCDADGSQVLFCQENMEWFLNDFVTDKSYLKDIGAYSTAKRGKAEAGPISWDECYVWNPAIALGGNERESSLEKGDMRVSLAIRAQLAPVTVQDI